MLHSWRAVFPEGLIPAFKPSAKTSVDLAERFRDGKIPGQEGHNELLTLEKQDMLCPNMAPHTN